jgi:hypothetical protein
MSRATLRSLTVSALALSVIALSQAACGIEPESESADSLGHLEQAALQDPTPGPTPTPEPLPTCYPFMKPDLVPKAQLIWPGVVYPLSASMKNQGTGPAGASSLRIEAHAYNGTAYVGKVISTVNVSVPALDCGKSHLPTLPWAPPISCGVYGKTVTHCEVIITADPAGAVAESIETNNVLKFTVTP